MPTYTAVSDFIKAGRNVDANVPQGDVIVKSGQDVTFQAANNIFLEDGFSVESGAKFDTRIAPCSSQPFNISVSNELTPCSNKLCVNVCTPPGQSYTISWSNGLGTLPQVEVSPTAPTTYTVTVRNTATGQIRTQSILVTPNYFPNPITFRIIPNVFTPNGDGINDVWRPDDYGKQTFAFNAYRYELEIVDRWGGRVLKEDETNTAPGFADDDIYWNGLKDNEGFELPGGVYYYSLKLYSCLEVKQYNGSISLLRSLGGIANPIEPMNVFDLATSSDQNSQENLIYPNPSTGLVNIQFASNKSLVFKVEVLDNLYKPLIIKHLNSEIGKTELDLAHLPNGIYFIRLISDTETTIRKLIISK
ncbi:MAG: gliding motility-associated C-terminal domain-containing protein [Microscillaceae bacterium]|nr:gliding motility-associated C-terminal domain-containing protein [Microscillaceae bacterium]